MISGPMGNKHGGGYTAGNPRGADVLSTFSVTDVVGQRKHDDKQDTWTPRGTSSCVYDGQTSACEDPARLHLRLKSLPRVKTRLVPVYEHASVSQGLGYAPSVILTINVSILHVPEIPIMSLFQKVVYNHLTTLPLSKRFHKHL